MNRTEGLMVIFRTSFFLGDNCTKNSGKKEILPIGVNFRSKDQQNQVLHNKIKIYNCLIFKFILNFLYGDFIFFCYGVGKRPPLYFFDKMHTTIH